MKKSLAIALVIVMIASLFVACGETSAAGNYTCTSMSAQGMTLDPSALGIEVTLTLNEDGTGAMSYGEQATSELTWTQNGNSIDLTVDDETTTATVDGDTITLTEDAAELVFTKN